MAIEGREEAGRRKGACAGEKKRKRRRYPGTVAHRHAIMWRLGLIYTKEEDAA